MENSIKRIDTDSRIFNLVLAILPILGIYSSFIPGISIGELILIIFIIVSLIKYNNKIIIGKRETILLFFIVYAYVCTIIAYFFNTYEFYWFNRLLRFTMYTCAIIVIPKSLFNKYSYFNYCFYLSIIICLTLILQYVIFYSRGTYFELYGNFLPLMDETRLGIDFNAIFQYSIFRPSSFFTEPAHASQFLSIPFTYFLFDNYFSVKKRTIAILISGLGILLTTSLWGISLLYLNIIVFCLIQIRNKLSLKSLLVLFIVIISLAFVFNSSFFQNSISRVDIHNISHNQTFAGRFGGYQNMQDIGIIRFLFGTGFGNVNNLEYSNSILYLLYGTGLFGLAIWIRIALEVVFNRIDVWKKMIFICFLLLLFGSSILISIHYVVIFVICAAEKNERNILE